MDPTTSFTRISIAALALILISLAIFTGRARAQLDPWEFEVYPYATESRGMLEIETDNAVVAKGHSKPGAGTSSGEHPSSAMWYNQFELTYGLTDRIEASAYLNMAMPSGEGYQYAGSKYRLRGQLFNQGEMPIDMGWYLELEWHRTPQFDDSQLEVEMRPILEKDVGRFQFVLNPKFEKAIFVGPDKNKGFEFGYSNGIYYRWMRYLSPGLEFYGGIGLMDDTDPLHEQQHYVFPVLWGTLPNGIEYSVGPGIGLTSGSDRVLVKFNFEIEKYVGALLGASPESSWFF